MDNAARVTVGLLVNSSHRTGRTLGGGLGLSEGLCRDKLIESARRHIWWDGHRHLSIVSAATGLDAGVIGPALAVWKLQANPNCFPRVSNSHFDPKNLAGASRTLTTREGAFSPKTETREHPPAAQWFCWNPGRPLAPESLRSDWRFYR